MTIADWLISTMSELGAAGVDAPRRDSLVLLEDYLHKDRAWVVSHPEHVLSDKDLVALECPVQRRLNREPLAYIRGKAWFYGRFFAVNPSVMIPRPESEAFITLLKDLSFEKIIDVGTGSGCLAITAKLEFPDCTVVATDISAGALDVAKGNAALHHIDISFIESDLLDSVVDGVTTKTAVIANLPYVPSGLITSPEITHEPQLALFSGKDGLDYYRRFWQHVDRLKSRSPYVLSEALESQHKTQAELAQSAGYQLQKTEQLTQLFVTSPHT
jgi:release factor glutamine methyltransferase